MKQKLGSIGRPVPGHNVKLMKDDGTFISKSDDEGEIVVQSNSPSIFSGYWNMIKKLRRKLLMDGYTQVIMLQLIMKDIFILKEEKMI